MESILTFNGYSVAKNDDIARLILKIVCSYPGCKIPIAHLQKELQRYGVLHLKNLETFLDGYNNNFMVQDGIASAFTNLEICPNHCRKNSQCNEAYCDKLHLCKFFLLSNCIFNQLVVCQFGHQLDSKHNSALIKRNLLDKLTTPELQRLFQSGNSRSSLTVPSICRFYNHQQGCKKNMHCGHLHICQFYVEGCCKFGPGCTRNHNIGDHQVLKVLTKFGIDTNRRPKDILQDLKLALPRRSERETLRKYGSMPSLSRQSMSNQFPSHNRFQPIRVQRLSEGPGVPESSNNEEICKYHLRGSKGCWFGNSCMSIHKSLPYQWQYLDGSVLEWTDFDYRNNQELETKFRDVNSSECKISIEDKSDSDDSDSDEESDEKENTDKGAIMVDFHTMKAFGKGRQLQVRRLGTASHVSVAPQVARSFQQQLTRWLWYWFNEENEEWIEYGQIGSSGHKSTIDSTDLEQAFVNDQGRIEFKVGQDNYVVKFAKMVQKQIQTHKKKNVRRRPEPIF